MKIVIDIDEDVYKDAKEHMNCTWKSIIAIHNALNNCTVIPKGHGRLADLDAALKCVEDCEDCDDKTFAIALFDWAMSKRVVLEADKEVNDES